MVKPFQSHNQTTDLDCFMQYSCRLRAFTDITLYCLIQEQIWGAVRKICLKFICSGLLTAKSSNEVCNQRRDMPLSTIQCLSQVWCKTDEIIKTETLMTQMSWHRCDMRSILTCARKRTWVSLIYRMEPTTKKCKNRRTKSRKTDMLRNNRKQSAESM